MAEDLRVKVHAPPVEGRANLALRKWIAKKFDLRPARVTILRGKKSGHKVLLLEGITLDSAGRSLDNLGIRGVAKEP